MKVAAALKIAPKARMILTMKAVAVVTATCNVPNWTQNGASSHGIHSSRTHSRKMHFSACGTSCHWPCHSQAAKNIAQEGNKHVIKTEHLCRVRAACFNCHKMPRRCFVLDGTTRAVASDSQLDDKSVTDTLILHVKASFISAERGLCQWILSQISLKQHVHFGSF